MEAPFVVQGGSAKNIWKHPVLLKHAPGGFSYEIDSLSRTRIAILVVAALIPVSVLLFRRLITGTPFFTAKTKRDFTVYNKSEFLELYDKDAVPSKAPIEPLEGTRRTWAWAQLLLLAGLVSVNIIALLTRVFHQQDLIEECAELGYWLLLLMLHAFRFYPTPYRPSLSLLVTVFCIVPPLLLIERDLWPKLLFNASPEKSRDARHGWEVYARLGLAVSLELSALMTPRLWYPVDPYSNDLPSPEQTASLISYMGSYSWIGNLIRIAYKRDIEPEDLPELPDYDRARLWSKKVENNKKSTTFKTFFACMRWDILNMTLCSIFLGLMQFVWPVSMRELLAYVEGSKEPVITPWVFVFGLFFGPLLTGLVWEAYIFNATRLVIRVKAAFTQSLLEKTLKIRFTQDSGKDEKDPKDPKAAAVKKTPPNQSKVGMINNLMSTDLDTLTNAREFFLLVGSVPVEIIFAVVFLYDLLGWASLVGIGMMVATMIVPILIAKSLAKIQRALRESTDARINLMSETLTAVRIIKFFGLEGAFLEKIREKREAELRLSLINTICSLGLRTVSVLLPIINIVVTFGIFTKVMNKPLTASIAFTSISLFDILRGQFGWLAFITQQVVYAFISFDRIDKFLNGEEELENYKSQESVDPQKPPAYNNATLSWSKPGSDEDNNFRLSDMNVECVYGGLTVVAGPVGSGKSSFILGLMGEMRLLEGSIHLPRQSGISYVAQSTWLQNASVKDNILFGSPYDERRYQTTIEACGLSTDLKNLEAGDETEIGERGTTLSGGQKARVSLARAVYSPAQTVFLDDVLSALDAETCKLVVEKCIKGDILAGRTVILVTHHVSLVASAAQKIIVLSDGKIVSDSHNLTKSTLDLLSGAGEDVDAEITAPQEADPDIIDTPKPADAKVPGGKEATKLVKEEGRAKGRVPKIMIWKYIKNFGGPFVIICIICLSLTNQFLGLANSYFVGLWSDQYTQHPDDVDVNLWLGLYAGVLMGTVLFETFTYIVWFAFRWIASRRIHEKVVKSVLYSPIRFFDTTPLGRIINRMSNDVKSVDSSLGAYLQQVFHQALECAFRLVVMSGLIPAFFIPTIAVSVVGIICGNLYVRAQLGVKRIVSVRESPLFSHFGDTISGIVTIRGFGVQDRFLAESLKRVDDFSQPCESLYSLNRWIGIRISWCTGAIGLAAGVIALTTKGNSAGLIGFSLSNVLAYSTSILYCVRYFTMFEVELNGFERLEEYIELEQEPAKTIEGEPPAAWPTEGSCIVKDLCVKYSKDGPDVLNKVSFDVKPRERVGIVGRTGAGKSSLALSLLRFTELSGGSISIGGLDIQKVNLEALRRRVTIIPQDPVLLSGTIRTNLDPFGEIDDSELQAALEGSGLAGDKVDILESAEGTRAPTPDGTTTPDVPARLKTKRINLNTPITAGGDNLSQGQRQLLAFARALVRRSKLVLLDEATSSTDQSTDERIQQTLRSSFPDSSLIVIAHRLRTVVNMDRIVVLDNLGKGGEVVEFDTPLNLLNNEGGVLRSLAEKSGEFEELLEIAKSSVLERGGEPL
ncbi:hypothetical protein P167DRAFT_500063 [Morchella conica CCBAS932]|uniref:P-loop containing nucleoside triphosphate hydrolase protein n=1 Tax=Morchella conica CCBAS932 TaxID=1392247 RepID=A0A3N4L550_9PEZI|nr:hypothetical protein P167DRAFT_500063 [Morchella conica CCBAS932]